VTRLLLCLHAGAVVCAAAIDSHTPEGIVLPVPQHEHTVDPEGGWTWGGSTALSPAQMQALQATVRAHKGAFAYSMHDLVGYNGLEGPFEIALDTDRPIFTKSRRYSALEVEICNEKCQELLDAGIICPAPRDTKYAAAATLPAKRDVHGRWTDKRFCLDFRALNKHTVPDKYGMPNAEDIFQAIGDARVMSKIDARAGFHQLPIAEADQPKTTFWWGSRLFMYKRVPYGLRNAPAKFCRVMDIEIAAAGLSHCCRSFYDDLILFDYDGDSHIKNLDAILSLLERVGLRAHPEKSLFGCDSLIFLGHRLSRFGLRPEDAKVAAIRNMRNPSNVSELRSMLGFMGYYRCYVANFSAIASPLNQLLGKGVPWTWGTAQQQAFDTLKDALCTEGKALRRFDPRKQTFLYTDWSQQGIGAVLSQRDADADKEYIVACVSRSLNSAEKSYSSFEGELLGVVWAVKLLRPYLYGIDFIIVTDHRPLLWLMSTPDLTGKHARWALCLMEHSFTIVHRSGKSHSNADVLSRFPEPHTHDDTGARMDVDAASAGPDPAASASTRPPLATSAGSQQPLAAHYNHLPALGSNPAAVEAAMQLVPVRTFMDGFAPTLEQLFDGSVGLLQNGAGEPPGQDAEPLAYGSVVSEQATQWVTAVQDRLEEAGLSVTQPLLVVGPADSFGVRDTLAVDTRVLGSPFWEACASEGIVLLELFGGICAGLDACLTSGVKVRQYLYCDTSAAARAVAATRLQAFCGQYPSQLPHSAVSDAFVLPQNVSLLDTATLVRFGAQRRQQWLVVAG